MTRLIFFVSFFTISIASFAQKDENKIGLIIFQNQVFEYEDGKKILNDSLSIISNKSLNSLLDDYFLNKYNLKKYTDLLLPSQTLASGFKTVILDIENNYLFKHKLSDSLLHIFNNIEEKEVMLILVAGKEREYTTPKADDRHQIIKGVGSGLGSIAGSLITGGLFIVRSPSYSFKPTQKSTTFYCLVFDKINSTIIYSKSLTTKGSPLDSKIVNNLIENIFKDYFK